MWKPLVCLLITTTLASAEDKKITGTFESVSMDAMLALPQSLRDDSKHKEIEAKHKALQEQMKQTLVITEKDITWKMGMGASMYMTYTVQGDFILGKTVLGTNEMFNPIYVKDDGTLFTGMQKFQRVKPDK